MRLLQTATAILASAALLLSCSRGPAPSRKAALPPGSDPCAERQGSLSGDAPPVTGPPEEGDWCFRRLSGAPNTLFPILTSTNVEFTVTALLFDGLVATDATLQPMMDGDRPIGTLAERIEHSPDYKVVTVTLKPGLTWHDGHPLTAGDFLFAWETCKDPEVPAWASREECNGVERMEVIDDRTWRVTMKEAVATWIFRFDPTGPLPRHYFEEERRAAEARGEKYAIKDSAFNRAPLGCGPYRFVSWNESNTIVLERWEQFSTGPKPRFRKVIFKWLEDDSVALNAFKNEEIDETEMTSEQFVNQAVGPAFDEVGYKLLAPQYSYSYVGWNMDGSNPFFGDLRVRKALALGVDVDAIIRNFGYCLPRRSTGPFSPDAWWGNREIRPLPYAPEEAGLLLDAAGWRRNPRTGLRERDGVPFEFELLCTNSPVVLELVEILQGYWQRLGVHALVRPLEWAVFHDKTQAHQYQALAAAWGSGIDPDYSSNLWLSTEHQNGRNYGKYSNPRVDELYLRARVTFDRAERARLYQEIHRLVYEDQPCLFLLRNPYRIAINRRIRGVALGPRGAFLHTPGFLDWWVPRPLQRYSDLPR